MGNPPLDFNIEKSSKQLVWGTKIIEQIIIDACVIRIILQSLLFMTFSAEIVLILTTEDTHCL